MKRGKSKRKLRDKLRSQKWFRQNLLISAITAIVILCMGIGYATLSTTLQVGGSAKILHANPVRIISISPVSPAPSCGTTTVMPTWSNETFTIDGQLPQENCILHIDITVRNDSENLVIVDGILENFFNNNNMLYSANISFNTTAAKIEPSGGQLTFQMSFYYKNGGWASGQRDFSSSFTLTFENVQPPIITMLNASRNFELFRGNDTFDLDQRVSALDDVDGDITNNIVKTCARSTGAVVACPNTWRDLPRGDYIFSYDVVNSFNLAAETLEVNVSLWDLKRIDSGTYHSVVVTSHGDLYTWGYNAGYRQGLDDATRRVSPIEHPSFSNIDIVDAAACNASGHAVDSDGNLWSWGTNSNNALGDGTITARRTPVKISPPVGEKYIQVECRYQSSAALTNLGNVYAWGWIGYGANGFGSGGDQSSPTKLTQLSNIVKIYMGYYNGAAIDSTGRLFTWGTNGESQLGMGSAGAISSQGITAYYNLPKDWQGITDADKICFGTYHAILARAGGATQTWGANSYGRLGNNSATANSYSPYTTNITNGVSCMANTYGSGIISSDRTAYLFGGNNYGEMGTGSTSASVIVPTAVNVPNVTGGDMQLDSSHLISDGITVYGFGYNGNGELGIGSAGGYTTTITAWDTTNLPLMSVNEW